MLPRPFRVRARHRLLLRGQVINATGYAGRSAGNGVPTARMRSPCMPRSGGNLRTTSIRAAPRAPIPRLHYEFVRRPGKMFLPWIPLDGLRSTDFDEANRKPSSPGEGWSTTSKLRSAGQLLVSYKRYRTALDHSSSTTRGRCAESWTPRASSPHSLHEAGRNIVRSTRRIAPEYLYDPPATFPNDPVCDQRKPRPSSRASTTRKQADRRAARRDSPAARPTIAHLERYYARPPG